MEKFFQVLLFGVGGALCVAAMWGLIVLFSRFLKKISQ